MELGAVAFVSNDFSTNLQNNKHAQSKSNRCKNETPTTVRNRDMSLNACLLDVSVLHKLLDALCAQHQALEDAYSELQEERNASADAIDDAMLTISRLQKEKFKLEMQHTQYRRETEVKLAHVQKAYNSYEDLLFHKDQDIQALQLQLQAYKDRFFTYGIYDSDIDAIGLPATRSADDNAPQSDVASYTEDSLHYLTLSSDVKRVGSHDSAGFTALNGGDYEKIRSKGNSYTGSCSPGEVSATVGFSNCVETNIQVNGGDGNAKSGFGPGKACERRTMSSEGYSYFGWSPQLCEAIEGLQKRLSMLSEKEKMNSDRENELRFFGEKLQSALTAYIDSLRQGSHAWQMMPAISEPLEAEEEEGSDGFVEVHVDTEQIRDLPQKTDPSSERYEEDGFSSLSLRKNGNLEPYRIRSSPVGSVIMKINTDPFSERYQEDGISSVSIRKNGSLEPYRIRSSPVGSVIMKINTDPFSERYGEDGFSSGCMGETGTLETYKCLFSGLFVGVWVMLSFRSSKRGLNRRNYHLTSTKNVGFLNLWSMKIGQKTCKKTISHPGEYQKEDIVYKVEAGYGRQFAPRSWRWEDNEPNIPGSTNLEKILQINW